MIALSLGWMFTSRNVVLFFRLPFFSRIFTTPWSKSQSSIFDRMISERRAPVNAAKARAAYRNGVLSLFLNVVHKLQNLLLVKEDTVPVFPLLFLTQVATLDDGLDLAPRSERWFLIEKVQLDGPGRRRPGHITLGPCHAPNLCERAKLL